MLCAFVFFFFFSSRRRHTRCSRDWSSDVCSSDLAKVQRLARRGAREGEGEGVIDGGKRAHRVAGARQQRWRVSQIGRASCRGRGEISGVAVSLKKKKKKTESKR